MQSAASTPPLSSLPPTRHSSRRSRSAEERGAATLGPAKRTPHGEERGGGGVSRFAGSRLDCAARGGLADLLRRRLSLSRVTMWGRRSTTSRGRQVQTRG